MLCKSRGRSGDSGVVPAWLWIVAGVVAFCLIAWAFDAWWRIDIGGFVGATSAVAMLVGVFGSAVYTLTYFAFDFDPLVPLDSRLAAMAKYCPCGCEKKLSLAERGMGKQVGMVEQRLAFLDRFALPLQRQADEDPEGLEEFIEDGEGLRDGLLAVIHGELSASDFDRRQLNGWIKYASKIETNTKTTLYRAQDGAP